LLHVDLAANAEPLWQQAWPGEIWGLPSPDGRHVAINGLSVEANVRMIDDF
jgi:hypothetical protein